jgi:hypothetical protein
MQVQVGQDNPDQSWLLLLYSRVKTLSSSKNRETRALYKSAITRYSRYGTVATVERECVAFITRKPYASVYSTVLHVHENKPNERRSEETNSNMESQAAIDDSEAMNYTEDQSEASEEEEECRVCRGPTEEG